MGQSNVDSRLHLIGLSWAPELHCGLAMQPRFAAPEITGTFSLPFKAQHTLRAWENGENMSTPWANLRSARWKAVCIGWLILMLAVTTWITRPHAIELHNILHHLNF